MLRKCCGFDSEHSKWRVMYAIFCGTCHMVPYATILACHIRPCLISFPKHSPEDCVHSHMPTGRPWNLQKTLEILVFLHVPSKGGSYSFRQNLIVSPKTFTTENEGFYYKILRQPLAGAKRVGAPQLDPTGAPSKNIGFPCVSEVPPLGFHWRPLCPRCRPDHYCQNLIIIEIPL